MPSLASGNSSCTACAITCAVEWRRMSRPSVLSIATASTLVAVGQLVGEVLELPRDPGRDDRGVVGEELPGLGARRDRPLLTRVGVDEGDLDVGHRGAPCVVGCGPVDRIGGPPWAARLSARRSRDAKESPVSRAPTAPTPSQKPDRSAIQRRSADFPQGRQTRARVCNPGSRGGRYWVRTSDLFGVNEARYHCANRPQIAPLGS